MNRFEKLRRTSSVNILIVLACLVIVIAGLKQSSGFFVPILLAFFIATVSFPITNWLRLQGVPRFFAVLVTVLVDFAFLTGVVIFGLTLISQLQEKWHTEYASHFSLWVREQSNLAGERLESWGVKGAKENFNTIIGEKMADLDYIALLNLSKGFLGEIASFLATSFIIILITVFMLNEARMFARRFKAVFEAHGPNFQRLMSAARDIQRYLGIKTFVSIVTGIMAGGLCMLMDLDFALLWGILAFCLNYIPAIGSVVAGIPPIMLALVTGDSSDALWVAIGYLLINTFLGNFIEPMMLGRRFGMSTLVVLISVLFWGWVWGPAGMLLAVPLTMVIKVGLDNSEDFRWVSIAISKEQNGSAVDVKLMKEGVKKTLSEDDGNSEANASATS